MDVLALLPVQITSIFKKQQDNSVIIAEYTGGYISQQKGAVF